MLDLLFFTTLWPFDFQTKFLSFDSSSGPTCDATTSHLTNDQSH
jgi:hypothetical protein